MKTWKFAAIAGALGLTVAANATFYTTEATFLAAIDPTFYLEDFGNFTFGDPLDGSQATWSAPGGNGYGWDVAAANGLWSNTSALSTNTADDSLDFTFTGLPVTAFAGVIANTDISGNSQGGTVTLTMSNGDTMTVADGTFLGWVGTTAVSGASIVAQDSANPNGFDWIQIDHAYTGATAPVVPEPASLAVLGLGAMVMLRRRKKA